MAHKTRNPPAAKPRTDAEPTPQRKHLIAASVHIAAARNRLEVNDIASVIKHVNISIEQLSTLVTELTEREPT
jgi:hypothetical protein